MTTRPNALACSQTGPSTSYVPLCDFLQEMTTTGAALAALRRCCKNPARGTYEMVKAFHAKGGLRKNLLKDWLKTGGNIAQCTVEIVKLDQHEKPGTYNLLTDAH